VIEDKKLRVRILGALNLTLLAAAFHVAACGSSESSTGKTGLGSTTCTKGTLEVTCWSPHETHFNVGNVPPGTPVTTPAPIFDANGCQAVEQVADGCCNAAAGGPEFDNGQCCYAFCTGSCC
jgi:hypothetical protein